MTASAEHSKMGRWSFRLSLLWGVIFSAVFAFAYLLEWWADRQGTEVDAPGLGVLFGLVGLVSLFWVLVALVLGVAGMLQRKRKRLYALWGTAISVVVVLIAWFGWIWPILEFFMYCNNDLPPIPRCVD